MKRCAQIIQGVLNFARETPTQMRHFNLVQLMQETQYLLNHHFKTKNITVDYKGPKKTLVYGDDKQMQQVLVNVLLNAVQASPPNSTIQITIDLVDQWVKVSIFDQGSGISDDALNQIFNPFFSTKPEGEGTGLGLSVSYGIVKKHQGNITIANRSEGGSVVTITLPHNSDLSQTTENVGELKESDRAPKSKQSKGSKDHHG